MPTVVVTLLSQRSKPVTDRVTWVEVKGRYSGVVHPSDVSLKPDSAEIVMDLVPDRYTMVVEVLGFAPAKGTFDVGFKPLMVSLTLENQCTLLPKVSDLLPEQRRLLQSLDPNRKPGEIWNSLSDNKAATFFQVSYALASIDIGSGTPLATVVDRIVRLGGSELTAPDTVGVIRSVVGWRMHVVFVGGHKIEGILESSGFKRDEGDANPVHKRFGYMRSYRERGAMPRMQVSTNYEGSGADVDLDEGAFHKSSPHSIYKSFAERFPDGGKIYKVK